MNDMKVLIEEIVADISNQAVHLDDLRLRLFLEWLKSHSSTVRNARPDLIDFDVWHRENLYDQLKNILQIWFESLPIAGLLSEYHLMLGEIDWWSELDTHRLAKIIEADQEK